MVAPKLDVEKFIEENDFHMWRLKIRTLLVHQRLDEALSEYSSSKKSREMPDED